MVYVHLGHPIVQKAQRLLRSALWSASSPLNRVTAVVVDDLAESFVAAVTRMVLVGRGGVRLHEEVFLAGVRLHGRRAMAEEKAEAALDQALDGERLALADDRTYDPAQVSAYFTAATQAALALAALRAPYRGRSTPVNAWWGTFDLAVGLFSGRPVDPPSNDFIMRNSANAEQIEVGWWPGDARYPHAAFFAFAFPAPDGYETATLSPPRRAGIRTYASSS